jgi:hypothetical protein
MLDFTIEELYGILAKTSNSKVYDIITDDPEDVGL